MTDIIEDLRANFVGECTEVGCNCYELDKLTVKATQKSQKLIQELPVKKLNMHAKFAEMLGEVVYPEY